MPTPKSQLSLRSRAAYRIGNAVARTGLGALMLLPYRWRVPVTGWVAARMLAPLAGFNRRTRRNLALICPELPEEEVRCMCRAVADNAARATIEQLSPPDFLKRAPDWTTSGDGWDAVAEALAQKRPVIVCSGHFGNYAAIRAAFLHRGHPMGGLYRRLANPYFNRHYAGKLAELGEPCMEQGMTGMRQVVRFLRSGGLLGILTDLHAHGGEELLFFGKPAVTSISTAEMALKFNALLVPGYAIRQPDGLSFHLELHAPIPHSDPLTMTQAMNDDLEAMVRQHMDQWFWIHRRWKPWVSNGVVRGLPEG